ncbi:MAG: hypothetical protein HY654_11185 [Acidobacteria bacterium]|nr:hypothetical protein [Acidobacteriota bacterium]
MRTPTRLRYGVVFSNEDGGTPADRLMATWGRATDIEYVYWVEIDEHGDIRSAGFEGPGHRIRSFAGERENRHSLLWVATLNNMIEDSGKTDARFRPAPTWYDVTETSREIVMDAQPWIYQVMAQEIVREGKVESTATAGSGRIPDPRSFVYIEACGELTNAALSFSINAPDGGGSARWVTSDAGLADFRIARSGCFRAAIALPADLDARRITSLRARAFPRPSEKGAPPPEHFQARLTRVNKVFTLTPQHVPGPSLLSWQGDVVLDAANPIWIAHLPPR